jgi:hypothetical protein
VQATVIASLLGLNPGGEVMAVGPLSEDEFQANVPIANRYRLLSEEEIQGKDGQP